MWMKPFFCTLSANLLLWAVLLSSCRAEVMVIPLNYRSSRSKRETGGQLDNLHGQSGEGYFMEMDIGTPPQKLNALVDTGSSNFAIAASPDNQITTFFYTNRSSSYVDSGTSVYVPYTQGEWFGQLGTDMVSLPFLPNTSVRADMAFITKSSQFFLNSSDWQGIVGFAYKEIARPDSSITPFFDHLVNEGHVKNIFSMHLCGSRALPNSPLVNSSYSSMDGTMILGGVLPSLHKGEIFYTAIHKEWYYEVVINDVAVDNISLGMDCKEYNYDKSIVDSGTTNLRFPEKVFNALLDQIQNKPSVVALSPSPLFWDGVDVECWDNLSLLYTSFPTVSVSLVISNNTFFKLTLLPQQYLRPVQDPTEPSLEGYCFKFGIATSKSGSVLGAVLMEGYYVIFDRAQKRIGFAETTCQPRDAATSMEDTKISGPYDHSGNNLLQCAYVKPEKESKQLMVVAYVMAAVCIMCVLPLVVMIVQYQIRKCRSPQYSDSSSDTGNLINR